jgi:glutamate racemase
MASTQPVGIFDSGLGGLTVARAIRERMPAESIIYYGDTARVPYGPKSRDTILQFTREAEQFFREHQVKCIVIACNTASALALPTIRGEIDIPVIGVIDPGAAAAVAATTTKKIGVIGTNATIHSDAYTQAIHRLDEEVTVYAQPCPLFVPLVEEGWCDRPATTLVIEEYLSPLKQANIDTLVLGCTHYPLLTEQIGAFMGSGTILVDSASTCAAELEYLLTEQSLASGNHDGTEVFFVTDAAARFTELGTRFLGRRLQAIRVVNR